MDNKKVYEVLAQFVGEDGLTYKAGEMYELTPETVATLPENTVKEYVPAPTDPVDPTAGQEQPVVPEVVTTEAVPWVGNHKIGS